MRPSVCVVPVGATDSIFAEVQSVLSAHRISFTVLADVTRLRRHRRASTDVAVVVGGPLDPSVLDALRILTDGGVPTLVLVQALTDHQEVLLLGAGAVDVVGVPTTHLRLDSRLAAHHRNHAQRPETPEPATESLLSLAEGVEVWPLRREVWVGERPVILTRTEYGLLLALAEDPDCVLTRAELVQRVGAGRMGARALESHLSRLRLKVRGAGGPRLVESVRGVGYRLQSTRDPDV